MSNVDFTRFTVINTKDKSAVIGQLAYMSIGSILIPRDRMAEIMDEVGLPNSFLSNRKKNFSDAFLSATTDVSDQVKANDGSLIKLYVRDNAKDKTTGIISREIVKEKVGLVNSYTQIGKFLLDEEKEEFSAQVNTYDSDLTPEVIIAMVNRAKELYELYKTSYNRSSIETIFDNILDKMDVSKVSVHGKLYFVPNYTMSNIEKLELLAEKLNDSNRLKDFDVRFSPVSVNAIYVINDEKQCESFKKDFYNTIGKEMEEYQKRLSTFIQGGCKSDAVAKRWLEKIEKLKAKKKNYEGVFNQSLDELNEQFSTIEAQALELKIQAAVNSKGNNSGYRNSTLLQSHSAQKKIVC